MADIKSQLQKVKQALTSGASSGGKKLSAEKPKVPVAKRTPHRSGDKMCVQPKTISLPSTPKMVQSSQMALHSGAVTQGNASERLIVPKSSVLTRQSEFHEPAVWVTKGTATQLLENPQGRKREAFIGFDFGTAYTKAAVGLLDKVFPVDWRGVLDTRSPYLLPTEYSALANGRCYLGQHPRAGVGDLITELKQAFIRTSPTDAEICRAAVFVALVLQYVRAWVYEHHRGKLDGSPLRWHLNIGTPSNGLEENERTTAYRRLACAAWSLSLLDRAEISFAQATRLLPSGTGVLPQDLVETDPVPEFIGQLAGYTKSAQRQKGLHALVDIGGGTVDMVTFNVHYAEGDDTFPFFVPRVEPLGTYAMVANRFRGTSPEVPRISAAIDDLMDGQEFSRATGISVATIASLDAEFSAEVAREVAAVFWKTRRNRYRQAPEWKHGVRTFVTGGGARLPIYADAVDQGGLRENVPLNRVSLPKHPRLDEFDAPDDEYHRISVACGLATNRLSLGAIVPANQVEDDLSARVKRTASPRPDRDELYPR